MTGNANPSSSLPGIKPAIPEHYGPAWMPAPVLLLTILALWVADLRTPYESLTLLLSMNFVFTGLTSLCIAWMAGRGFLASGQPGLIMFGCGVLLWGLATLAASQLANYGANIPVTIHNLGVLGAATCHLAGLLWRGQVRRPGVWLGLGYTGVLVAVALLIRAAMAGWIPVFFVQDQGGTLLRQVVLVAAGAMFGVASWLMLNRHCRQPSAFLYWYGLGLVLLAVGLLGVMLQSVPGSALSWSGRVAQFLGGAYMLMAALVSVRETGTWRIPFQAAEWDDRLLRLLTPHHLWSLHWGWRYGLVVVLMVAATTLRVALLPWIGTVAPYNVVFLVTVATTILLGIGPGLLCLLSGAVAMEVFVVGSFAMEPDGVTIARLALSIMIGAFLVGVLHSTRLAHLKSRKNEARLTALYASMAEGLAGHEVVYAGGKAVDYILIDVNPAFERITGIPRERAVGARASALYGSGEPPYLDIYAQVAENGKPESFETDFAPMGKNFHISVSSPGKRRFTTVFEDITERKRAEEALHKSEARLREANVELRQSVAQEQAANIALREARRAAVNLMQDAVAAREQAEQAAAELQRKEADLIEAQRLAHIGSWHWDAKTDVTTGSEELLRIYGFDPSTQTMPDFKEQRGRCYPEEDWERINAAVQRTMETGVGYELDARVFGNNGTIWVTTRSEVVRDADYRIVGLRGTVQDITERQRAEEKIEASLAEKDAMLREIHHRVKNNLQVISSLVSLQADTATDEQIHEALKDVRDRVRSMALIHEKLYQTSNLAQLDFAEYAASLLHSLWHSHGTLAEKVRLNLALKPVGMPIEAAVPCGLILNELAGNALKHAFPGNSGGEVTVCLEHDADTFAVCLRVGDNGVGLPADLDWGQSRSLGLRLVKILTGQLRGTVETGAGPGTEFQITFPLQGVSI